MAAGVELHTIMKYVDDVNLVMAWLRLSTRWIGDTLEHRMEWERDDVEAGRTEGQVTMEAMRKAANSIIPWLQFTVDEPSQHSSGTVPMLDLQVWVWHPAEGAEEMLDTLGWFFFVKATSSSKVLRASLAYGWRSKIMTLTMEVHIRMRNTMRQATADHRADILTDFVRKLRESSYVQSSVTGILKSGMEFYIRKLRIQLQGGPPVNQRRVGDTVARRRAKLGGSESWFARRRGGQREKTKKENNWRKDQPGTQGGRSRGRQTLSKYSNLINPNQNPGNIQKEEEPPREGPKTISTLLVPYTVGSLLKDKVQEVEDNFRKAVGSMERVRVVEKGGDVLGHLLCRNDPWASKQTSGNSFCVTCRGCTWLQDQQKEARKNGTKLPDVLEKKTSHQCRREGCNYSLQCLDCALGG